MGTFDFVSDYLRGKSRNKKVSGGRCPNSWGRQEYEGVFLEATQNDPVDLNNIVQKKGWIQAYVEKYFEGLHSKTVDGSPSLHNSHTRYF